MEMSKTVMKNVAIENVKRSQIWIGGAVNSRKSTY